jgi:N6-adenosine-specific RNA methylase IME4
MKYKTIVIDPPWKYGNWGAASKNSTMVRGYIAPAKEMDYPTMTIDEIKALPVKNLADENCELYVWTTQKYLPFTYEILKHWGFKYCTTLTWCKKPMGKGQGGVYTPTTEFLVHGRIGKMPKVERIDSTWFEHKRQSKHSKKPEFFQDLIEIVSEAPRLEMFAITAKAFTKHGDLKNIGCLENQSPCFVNALLGEGAAVLIQRLN